ncbi:hypothetical protein M430DRAFT_22727 [Amorphotheca resinae ATCC 22711]|uniref:Uncharacterized protein n=1 Tax=Amorphotheca resinae ATCC 22711 TaxID=857342 RepID=A0A2T3AQE4_AMORE|nr:hypothetical protein M430DRAFT_22727 [Amorphotheca resinae ATCC 22711]PSS08489.1 hypothetical protein M430DRAFT_22727 [Amorphotheca resinae ATCC 22711]
MASKDAAIFPDRSPKRVVLRLKVSELERRSSSEYDDAIKAYLLLAGRPANEDESSFYIIIDLEKYSLVDGEFWNLPHEIYHVRRFQDS